MEKEGLHNVTSIQASVDSPNLPEPLDFIMSCNTYHHFENRVKYFSDLKTKLKPQGKIVIIDWKKGDIPSKFISSFSYRLKVGPPDHIKFHQTQVIEELEKAGYVLDSDKDLQTPYHYNLIFAKKE